MSARTYVLAGVPLAALLASSLYSYGSGVDPYTVGVANLTKARPSCGNCHSGTQGANSLKVKLAPTARSLTPGQSLSVTLSATGGVADAQLRGGFTCDVSSGAFTAGTNSRLTSRSDAITHSRNSGHNRTWTYGYTASTNPGLIEMYATLLTSNGSGTSGDIWGFAAFNSAAVQGTAVRLYVNAPGVVPVGSACAGSYENVPVFGAKQAPQRGNAAFGFDLFSVPASAGMALLVNGPSNFTLDLAIVGITGGCNLLVDPANVIVFNGATTAGDPERATATGSFPMPIPNSPSLAGVQFQCQVAILDVNSGRPTPITMTNALRVTVQ